MMTEDLHRKGEGMKVPNFDAAVPMTLKGPKGAQKGTDTSSIDFSPLRMIDTHPTTEQWTPSSE
jgi:hypothetical protein